MNNPKQVQRRLLVPDKNLSSFPYNCILCIEILYNDEFKVTATSFLIASNLLITSANCFIRKQKKGSVAELVTVCQEGRKITLSAQSVKLNQKFVNQMKQEKNQMWGQSLQADFALIMLPQKIRRPLYFILEKLGQQKQEQINVCGFVQANPSYKLYEKSNKIKVYKNLGYYDIDIDKGQRGSPVFLLSKPRQVIGIHKGKSSLSNLKICCLVTNYLIQTVQKWKKDWNITDQEPQISQNKAEMLQSHLQQPNNLEQYRNQVIRGSYYVALQKLIHQRQKYRNLQVLSLQGEQMRDKGIQELCCCQLPNIQKVNLNDNLISMAGAVSIVQNKWNEQATYVLDSVITKEGGYALNVGQNIPLIKSFIKGDQISFSKIDTFDDTKQLYQGLQLIMEMPFRGNDEQVAKQSAEIQLQMKESVQNSNQRTLDRLLLTMKQILGESAVTFSRKSNIKSQLSWKVLTVDLMNKRVMIKHKITSPQWNFKDFHNNSKQVIKFRDWYLKKLAQEYKADNKDLTIHKLTEGSVEVIISVDTSNPLIANPQFSRQRIQVIPFFQGFQLSPDEFDTWHDYEYSKEDNVEQLQRGGIPFFRPIHCKKFAIKVQNIYDGGNNDWLQTQNPNQWAIAYHGIRNPDQIVQGKKLLKLIMEGRQRGEMLKIGKDQHYKDKFAINKPNETVGQGIYLSPYFTTCLLYYTLAVAKNNQEYHVVLMVRIKPAALKIVQDEPTYWVINQSKDIRPCGILLFTAEQEKRLRQLGRYIYGQVDLNNPNNTACNWQRWRHKYQQFRKDNNLV